MGKDVASRILRINGAALRILYVSKNKIPDFSFTKVNYEYIAIFIGRGVENNLFALI